MLYAMEMYRRLDPTHLGHLPLWALNTEGQLVYRENNPKGTIIPKENCLAGTITAEGQLPARIITKEGQLPHRDNYP